MRTREIASLLAVVTLLSASAGTTHAQDARNRLEKFERQLELIRRESYQQPSPGVSAGRRALIDYGLSVRFIFAAIDDRSQDTHLLRQTDAVGFARVDLDGVHQFFLRARTTYRDFNEGDSFDGHGDDWVEPQIERLHYRFDLRRYMQAHQGRQIDGNFVFLGGRQLVHWGNGLTLSEEIDGAQFQLEIGDLRLDSVVGQTRPSTTDFDPSRPLFDDDTKRMFYGGMLSYQVNWKHRPYIYGLVQEDHNNDPTVLDANGSFTDNITYGIEFAYEGGKGLSRASDFETGAVTTQTEEDISAWAFDAQLDWLLRDDNHTRFSFELILASGDDDRQHSSATIAGNAPGTDDNGFNAFGLINTGFAFAPDVSNIIIARGGVLTFPAPNSQWFRRLQVGANVLIYNKMDSDGQIDEFTSDDTYLGTEADLYANWQITSDLSAALRYGVFFPGDAIITDRDPRHFLYTGVTLAF
jgi:hypothetical protein